MCSTLRRMNDWRGEEVGIVRAADLMGGATAAEEGGGRKGVHSPDVVLFFIHHTPFKVKSTLLGSSLLIFLLKRVEINRDNPAKKRKILFDLEKKNKEIN